MPRRPRQLTIDDQRRDRGRGGLRSGAGRKPGPNPPVHHVRRSAVPARFPLHISLRLRRDVAREIGSLRRRSFLRELRATLRACAEREGFRVVHYSVQTNHLHLLIEAPGGKQALGRGMKAVGTRFAHAVNRVFRKRGRGGVLYGRYAMRILRTQREVRHALAYVLLNVRKHWFERFRKTPPVRLDEASSGRWFDGWAMAPRAAPAPSEPREVATPRTFFLVCGWRRHGLIDPAEVPALSRTLRIRRTSRVKP